MSTKKNKNRRRRHRERGNSNLSQQLKAQAIRAKYGPARRAMPVTVKSVDTGEILRVEDQSKFRARTYSPVLEAKAQAAGYASYSAYIDSGYWKAIRERVLNRDGRCCQFCRGRSNLTVHHDRYDNIGNEKLEHLKTICWRCHHRLHKK